MQVRSRPLLTVATAALLATLMDTAASATAAPDTTESRPVVLSQGHVDVLDIAYEDGELAVHVHDETIEPDVERDPGDVVFQVKPAAKTTVPAEPAYEFLGEPGDDVWILPQTENPELLFAGLSTEEIPPGAFAADAVTLTLLQARGPGQFSLFTTDGLGSPTVVFHTGDGTPDATSLPTSGHQHANWAFEGPGWYTLTFTVEATVASTGERINSGPVAFRFQVLA